MNRPSAGEVATGSEEKTTKTRRETGHRTSVGLVIEPLARKDARYHSSVERPTQLFEPETAQKGEKSCVSMALISLQQDRAKGVGYKDRRSMVATGWSPLDRLKNQTLKFQSLKISSGTI